ncbi:MAG TPA: ketol-acid reductoisomerase [Phycisphaerae bacterium]|nr:ketol-acid reductoisomerase [Phycisphaerae bacterium]
MNERIVDSHCGLIIAFFATSVGTLELVMPLPIYYENDADLGVLRGSPVAILGYGRQGRAHALNLRDSGVSVVVGQRTGGPNYQLAIEDGFGPVAIRDAVAGATLLIFALPDERMGEIYEAEIAAHLRAGQTLGFVHGFAIRFGLIRPPADVDVVMIAPKGPGTLVRDAFVRGGGLTCVLAVHQDISGRAKDIALAWGRGVGGGRGGMIETTFAAECEADLFGEQAVLCGGAMELMKAAFDVLVEAGYPEEIAHFECMHELKQITDMQYADGLAAMRSRISGTACYGGLTRGPRLIDERVKREMRAMLAEIRDGSFAREWIEECRAGRGRLDELKAAEATHGSEAAGEAVRRLASQAMSGRRE